MTDETSPTNFPSPSPISDEPTRDELVAMLQRGCDEDEVIDFVHRWLLWRASNSSMTYVHPLRWIQKMGNHD